MGEYQTDLDALFGAMADPTRRAILDRLAAGGETRVTDLAADFPISLNSVSKHVRVLEGAGLVARTVRGREHLLALNQEPLDHAARWIEEHRRFWENSLAGLAAFVEQAPGKSRRKPKPATKSKRNTTK
jgi:DNA-binding transcriptional ArsR family regulator